MSLACIEFIVHFVIVRWLMNLARVKWVKYKVRKLYIVISLNLGFVTIYLQYPPLIRWSWFIILTLDESDPWLKYFISFWVNDESLNNSWKNVQLVKKKLFQLTTVNNASRYNSIAVKTFLLYLMTNIVQ